MCYKFNLSRPNPGRREKIKLNFYFHTSLWCLNRFYEGLIKPFEAPQRSVTIKNELIFISTQLSGIHRTLRVNDDAQNNRGDKTLYMKVCFETFLDDEGFLKWLDNTVDYKLYS